MERVLLTGMSGSDKSSMIEELRQRGFRVIDVDVLRWSEHMIIATNSGANCLCKKH